MKGDGRSNGRAAKRRTPGARDPTAGEEERYPPIDRYALIGDCHSVALVSTTGSIDWACLPRLDGGSCFGRLLDWDKGGSCSIRPVGAHEGSRRYLPGTMVLETTLRSGGGEATLTDCFTMRQGGRKDPHRQLLRVIEGTRGRIDLEVRACTATKRKLIVIGTGQDERRLRALAGPTVTFLGWQPDEAIRDHFRRCRALLFPGEEDFGIVPVEAQACGAAVIAFARGGAAETVVPPGGKAEPTGLLFREQSTECLAEAMDWFERHTADFSPNVARRQALHFNPRRFDEEIGRFVDRLFTGQPSRQRRAA